MAIETVPKAVIRELSAPLMPAVEQGVEKCSAAVLALAENQDADFQAAIQANAAHIKGGHYIRGLLVAASYRLHGGTDMAMIGDAAGAIQETHGGFLNFDDIQDGSEERRSLPAAWAGLRGYFRGRGVKGHEHTAKMGRDVTMNASLIMLYQAQETFNGLNVDGEYKTTALDIFCQQMMLTGMGQMRDVIAGGQQAMPSPEEILKTTALKTAHYTMIGPPKFGGALAGAALDTLEPFDDWGLNAGIAFQLADDNEGVFGDSARTGKPANDIHEGKKTWLMATAMEQTNRSERRILRRALGNRLLTGAQLAECQDIIRDCGALKQAEELIGTHRQTAAAVLDSLPKAQRGPDLALFYAVGGVMPPAELLPA